ncbi:hypothetical protein T484DRAFT_1619607 [Baffinella frigidus]|nr:hypothetical protein T484DRAFT_1619607 [Cryptophyta sp. CCMP2293]
MTRTLLSSLSPEPQTPNRLTPNLQHATRNPKPSTRNPKPATRNPKTETCNPKPATRNPKPLNPQPETRNREAGDVTDCVSRGASPHHRVAHRRSHHHLCLGGPIPKPETRNPMPDARIKPEARCPNQIRSPIPESNPKPDTRITPES